MARRITKVTWIICVAVLLDAASFGPIALGKWISGGVGAMIRPFSEEFGLAPDYAAFRVIPAEELRDQDPEVIRGLDAYNRKDFKEAYRIWLPLAEAGNAEAQFRVGRLFDRGEGVKENANFAALWFAQAAEKGHVSARTTFGIMQVFESSVPETIAKGVKSLELSHQQGDPYAASALANAYMIGKGVKNSPEMAVSLYTSALEQGGCRAANELSRISYAPPPNMVQDLAASYRYAEQAKSHGCEFYALITLIEMEINKTPKKHSTESSAKISTGNSVQSSNEFTVLYLRKLIFNMIISFFQAEIIYTNNNTWYSAIPPTAMSQ